MKKWWSVWSEGFAATGEHGTAQLIGEAHTETFKEACDLLCKDDPNYNAERGSVWGCRLFPTEHEARKMFG